ncbi:hypothetical protein [Candidatus Nitrosotalea sp. TS]|uniref:hypothetical protein n=1 Tax=Candidatus Nitrosotalea sp. TS TaxID=2341020 RepID=UPI00140AD23F|nr:hypothetical protein [Candidatus Nitrosotalea sp. TS]
MEFRILDVLTREIGNALSINKIAEKVRTLYGSGDYKNIYVAINNMNKDKIVTLEQAGNTSIASINFENYLIIDLLSEMELRKKRDFLKNRQEMQMLMLEFDTYLYNQDLIQSISIINPERNAKLNKAEFLVHLKKSSNRKVVYETKLGIYVMLNHLQMIHTIRIDALVLEDDEVSDLLKSNEANPVREMFYDKIAIFSSQSFWLWIRNEIIKGMKIKTEEHQTHPAKISEEDLVYNLARFGYTEFGPKIKEGRQICMEYTIAAIMFRKDARRIDAIAIMLAKNTKRTNYDLLLFISRKYDFAEKILGILKSLRNLVTHVTTAAEEPIRLLESMNIEEIRADEKNMKDRLKLYRVT